MADGTGTVAGFADATGRFLPWHTINAARILDLRRACSASDHDELGATRTRGSGPGAHGLTLLPYFDGERTPNRPDAAGTCTASPRTTREDLARAAVEALLCSLADAVAAPRRQTAAAARRVLLIGGAARNPAVRALAPAILGRCTWPARPASTSPSARPVRPPGRCPARPSHPTGRVPTRHLDRRPDLPTSASATPRCATAPRPTDWP